MDQEVYYFGDQTYDQSVLEQLTDMTRGTLCIDVETVSLENRELLGIGFCLNETDAYYFPIDSSLMPWHLLENNNITKLMHNGAFDLGVLLEFLNLDIHPVYDSLIEAQLQGFPQWQLSMDALAQYYFGTKLITIEDLIGKKGKNQLTMDQVPEIVTAEKCAQDVLFTMRIWNKLLPNINWPVFDLEMALQPVLVRMENYGLRIDEAELQQHWEIVNTEVEYYLAIANGLGFNPGSSKQLAAMLEARGWKVQYDRTTFNPKLSEKELSTRYTDEPLAHLVLNYRKKKILRSTFIEALWKKHLVGGRIFPRVNQGITATGRLTRTKPNTQNIPYDMRNIFIPTKGNILECWDLSQIELRILAFLIALRTNDFTMLDVFLGGGDIHDATLNYMMGLGHLLNLHPKEQRTIAKTINFAAAYRGTEHTLYVNSGIPLEQGKIFLDAYFQTYWGLNILFDMVCTDLRRDGYTETLLGRRRYFPDLEAALSEGRKSAWLVEKIYREGFNHIIQGTAGEDIKQLQIRNKYEQQVNAIHDEIVFDISPNHILNRDTANGIAVYRTPMEVKRGMNWRDTVRVGVWG